MYVGMYVCMYVNSHLEQSLLMSFSVFIQWMFTPTYCEYWGKHYTLDSGPIGLGATCEIAIRYVEEFQFKVVKESP